MTRFGVLAMVLLLVLVEVAVRHDDPHAGAAVAAAKRLLASSARRIYARIAERAEVLR